MIQNKKSKYKNKSKLFKQFFIPYFILTVILILVISTFSYSLFINKLREEVDSLIFNTITIVQDYMETKFDEMNRIAYEIEADIDFMPYNLLKNGYREMRAVNKLKSYCSANTYIKDLVVYYTDRVAKSYSLNSKFITASGACSPVTFLKYIYSFKSLDYKTFIKKINSVVDSEIWYPVITSDAKRDGIYLIYIRPLGNFTVNINNRGVIFFLIDQKELSSMLKTVLSEYKGTFRIIDNTGRNIYHLTYNNENGSDLPFEFDPTLPDKPVFQSMEFNKIPYTRIKLYSPKKQWTYIMDIPSNNYKTDIYDELYPFYIWIPLIMILGSVGVYILSLQNYRPIGNLLDVFAQYNKQGDISIANIITTLKEMEQINTNLQVRIQKQQNLCQLQCIQNLIHGRFRTMESLTNQIKECNIVFNGTYFAVLVIHINNIDKYGGHSRSSYLEEIKYTVIRAFEEIYAAIGDSVWGVPLGPEQGIAIVLCLKDSKNIDIILQKGEKNILDFFKNTFNIGLTIGVGRIYKNPLDISRSYSEASDAVSFEFVQGSNRIYTSDQIRDAYHKKLHWYPEEEEKDINKLIINGQYKLLEDKISTIFNNIETMMLTPDIVRSICISLVNIVKRIVKDMKLEINEEMIDKMDNMISMKYRTMWQFKDELLEFCSELCDIIVTTRESKNNRLKTEVEKYINTYYYDSNLTLTSIAQKFNISPSYLTRYFKNHTGISLMRYLDNIRMEHAKKLLESTQLPLDEVVEQCGYVDKNNFIQKFKKTHGYTPIQYRKIASECEKLELI